MEKAWKNIAKAVKKGQRVGVAVSGGADSVYLLHAFLTAENIDKKQILVINIEHGIRGESSVRDSKFVADLAQKNGLELAFFALSVPQRREISGRSEETEARIARREIFDSLLQICRVDLIATAHHKNDKTESVLMHLFRGCGTAGLVGMEMQSGQFIRPLIDTTRDEIEQYLSQNGIDFVTDESNFDTTYTRNFIRHEIVPKINERYDIVKAIETVSTSARADEDFIRSQVKQDNFICEKPNEISIKREVFDLHNALISRYLMMAVEKIGRKVDFESKHICSIIELSKKENGKSVNLVGGLVAINEYDRVTLYIDDGETLPDEIDFDIGFYSFGEGFVSVFPTSTDIESGVIKIDCDKVPSGAIIRTKRTGDTFRKFGGQSKKLKDYLIDKKIPVRNRDKLPLLCYNNKVLAIFGVEIADEIKITDRTTNAVELKFWEN
ncbi:MAG: tRNA lysidine(34) synthetase TilS [Clostridia bacterium]|nr:tRNA lysidine(34) synthetase TilS [Clostridia bacterium]